jgi:hypothetical protein
LSQPKPRKCVGEFVAFRTLHEALPFNEKTEDLVCRCLEYYLCHSGKRVDVVERFLAQHRISLCELEWKEKQK